MEGKVTGLYKLERTQLDAIPQIYEVWLMDNYKKDSLDIRNNSTYAFNVNTTDTNSYGKNRFYLVIRENPALMVHLLNFTGKKSSGGSQIAWVTENEQNYTNFTVERSNDGGATYEVLGGFVSGGQGTYSFLDKNPPVGSDMYRLKIQDLNGAITYSDVVTLVYGNGNQTKSSNISVYPNPASSVINLTINQNSISIDGGISSNLSSLQTLGTTPILNQSAQATGSTPLSYGIKIISITGSVITTATTSSSTWQKGVSNLSPGTYIIQVLNNANNGLVGSTTFIKM